MFNRLKLNVSQNKMLLLAIIISLILHSLVFTKLSISFPELNIEPQMLEMRLVKLPTPQKPTPNTVKRKAPPVKSAAPVQQTAPLIRPIEPEPVFAPRPVPSHKIEPIAEIPANTENLPEAHPQLITQEAKPIVADSTATESAEIVNEFAVDEYAHQAYKHIETEFEVRRGNDSGIAGEALIIFNIKDDKTYRITSLTQASGLASLFFDKLKQVSEGSVTDSGLVPFYYSYQYGNKDDDLQHADFLWSDGILEMYSRKGKNTEKLLAGTQDFLSFMYQFMFIPPLEKMNILVTNGRNLRTYSYSFEGEEIIQTKFEAFNTIHLLKKSISEEKTELWLATDYQHIPIKIRKTESNGNVIEQIATKITTVEP